MDVTMFFYSTIRFYNLLFLYPLGVIDRRGSRSVKRGPQKIFSPQKEAAFSKKLLYFFIQKPSNPKNYPVRETQWRISAKNIDRGCARHPKRVQF
tara:strand:+ start:553 stop:837 length:285 start_codon:yes stop_codon:yes gene_type:complete